MIRMTFAVVLLVIAGVSATGTDAQLPSGPTAPRTAIQFGQATDVASVNFVLARPAEVLPAQPG